MERAVLILNAKNKAEALTALDMALKAIQDHTDRYRSVSARVCVTNEGDAMDDINQDMVYIDEF